MGINGVFNQIVIKQSFGFFAIPIDLIMDYNNGLATTTVYLSDNVGEFSTQDGFVWSCIEDNGANNININLTNATIRVVGQGYNTFNYGSIYGNLYSEIYLELSYNPNCSQPSTSVSRITSFSYSTTTATANVQGYWEATTTPQITQNLSFWQFSNTLGKESYKQLTATTTGYFNFSFPFLDPYAWVATTSTTTMPIYNSFTLNASLNQYDDTNYVFPYGGTVITNLDATSTEVLLSQYNASDFISNPRQLALYPEYECSISSLTGCFKNAIIWAFYPTQEVIDNWNSLLDLIQTKAPIGYFYMTKNSINGLSATSTKSFNIVIPSSLKTYIFNPFDTGVSAILWFFFIMNFYKRLKTITI